MSHENPAESWTDRFGRPAVPFDLLAVVGYVAVALALLSRPGVYGTPLAVALGLPLLFFVPGYSLISLLFPGATPDDTEARRLAERRQHGLGGVERLALGFGLSVALLPILAVALGLSPWTIGPVSVLLSVSAFAVVCVGGAAIRRLRRPPDRRFSVPVRAWFDQTRRTLGGGSISDALLNVGLAVAVVLAVAAIGYAVADPGPGQRYTGVALLSANETGELVADDYPRNFEQGVSRSIVVEVTNHEGRETTYSVVVELQRVRQAPDGSAKVLQDRRLATFTPTVEDGGTWRTRHEVTPTMTGENLRLVYLVYEGDPPDEPTTENAYRHVHVWVNVSQ